MLFDLDVAEGACVQPNIGQSNVRKPFADFGDGPDDLRQANAAVEQLGDLPGARQVTKAE